MADVEWEKSTATLERVETFAQRMKGWGSKQCGYMKEEHSGRLGGQWKGPKAGVCLACSRPAQVGEEAGEGEGRIERSQLRWGPGGHCKDFGFYSVQNGEPLEGSAMRKGMIWLLFLRDKTGYCYWEGTGACRRWGKNANRDPGRKLSYKSWQEVMVVWLWMVVGSDWILDIFGR